MFHTVIEDWTISRGKVEVEVVAIEGAVLTSSWHVSGPWRGIPHASFLLGRCFGVRYCRMQERGAAPSLPGDCRTPL
jgi:hypothetical protein